MDPYSKFDNKQKAWFMALIEGMVSNPKSANFARVKGCLDLEVRIRVAPEDAHIFTQEVCVALEQLLGAVTDTSPVVYLDGHPHPAAEKAILASLNDC